MYLEFKHIYTDSFYKDSKGIKRVDPNGLHLGSEIVEKKVYGVYNREDTIEKTISDISLISNNEHHPPSDTEAK